MQGIYKNCTIDLSCNNNFVQIPTMQGDGNEVRGAKIKLIANNVQYVVDPAKTIISIGGIKPDTSDILNDCKVTDDGCILVDITSQMAAVPGRGDYQIVLIDRETEAQLTSFPFYILTTASFNAKNIVSSNEFQLLANKIVIADNAINFAEEKLKIVQDIAEENEELNDRLNKNETSRINAEKIRNSNENTRKSNEDIRIDNENQRINNETSRQANETKRINAETIRVKNESKRSIAEQNRINAELNRANAEEERKLAEKLRVLSEEKRVSNETERINQENARQTASSAAVNYCQVATENADTATARANAISEDLEEKLKTNYFKGEPGKDGVVTTIEMNQLAFSVVDGDLILAYETGNTDAEKFSLNENGELIYTLS